LNDAIPFIVWSVLIVASGEAGITALVHGELWPCIASFGLLAGITAAFIYWRQITLWGPLAYALATLLIAVSVWSSSVWDRLFPPRPSPSNGSPDQTQLAAMQQERDQLRTRVQTLEAQLPAIRGQSPIPPDQRPITWGRLLLQAGAPRMIKGISFGGESVSPVKIKDAFVVSDLTRDKIQFTILTPANGQFVPLDKINEIPADASIELLAEFSPWLSAADFLDKWGKATIEIVYDDGRYSRSFDEAYMRLQVAGLIPGAAGPRVTKKTGDQ
jgi:hypothetical protein